MPRSANQKLKLLYLRQLLLERSDEEHPVTLAEMQTYLAARDIQAERKSLYDDLESLRRFGMDIIAVKGKTFGYYVGERDFELAELKLLVDSVQSSKFITEKKTLGLISKLEALASVHQGKDLQRQVVVRDRVKTMNESVFYTVDAISAAISDDCAIRFHYAEYALDKSLRFRRRGAFYEVSPYALIWEDENYYLLAWSHADGEMRHYRVDKMKDIGLLDEKRRGKETFAAVDLSAYSKKVFAMYAGEEKIVRLRFASHLVGTVIDRFGKDVIIVPDGEDHFTVTLNVVISPQFHAWLFGYGTDAEILSPAELREEVRQRALRVAKLYEQS